MHEKELSTLLQQQSKYFEEAIKWHNTKHHSVFTERSWLIVFTFALCFSLFVVVKNIFSLMPLKVEKTFLYYTNNMYEQIPKIQNLFAKYKNDSNLQSVVEKYLLSYYVKAWNSSTGDEERSDTIYIKKHSSYRIYLDFIRRKKHEVLKIKDIYIEDRSDTATKLANIKFIENKSNKIKKVRIRFKASEVLLAYKKIVPFSLVVTDYEEL